jgi:hypothetical protein
MSARDLNRRTAADSVATGRLAPDHTVTDYPVAPVPGRAVQLRDGFLRPRLETNRAVTIPSVLDTCERSGRVANLRRAARPGTGGYTGKMPFEDTDVYKAIEGASGALGAHADPDLDARLDALIAVVASAQEPDGYLYTSRTLGPLGAVPFMGPARWSNLAMSHELYNCGHLYDAACAHFEATGKRSLLEVALKSAELVCREFGPNARHDTCGHPIIEMALCRLSRVTGNRKFLEQARFFLEQRGRHDGRGLYRWADDDGYAQDHLPVGEQREVVGHAVRAMYLFCGMADVAAMAPDPAYVDALIALWEDMTRSKVYLTGGVGARHKGESFGRPFELPNETAYAETCAAIGSVMWNRRMFLLTGHARYLDVIEQTLYNGILSGVSLDGKTFFYTNPLASDGTFGFNQGSPCRQPWFDVSCCPTSLCRFLPTVPGYLYAAGGEDIYVTLYAEGSAEVRVGGVAFSLEQTSRFPWEGEIRIVVRPREPARARLRLRVPGWVQGSILGGDLHRAVGWEGTAAALRVNGKTLPLEMDNGFAVLDRTWTDGDIVELSLPLPLLRVRCDQRVEGNVGHVALQRGPIVFCVEENDTSRALESLRIGPADVIVPRWEPELLGGVVALEGPEFVAVPYAAWGNRGRGAMAVWLRERG